MTNAHQTAVHLNRETNIIENNLTSHRHHLMSTNCLQNLPSNQIPSIPQHIMSDLNRNLTSARKKLLLHQIRSNS